MLTQYADDLFLGKTASPHRSSPSDELTYQWHDFRGAGYHFEKLYSRAFYEIDDLHGRRYTSENQEEEWVGVERLVEEAVRTEYTNHLHAHYSQAPSPGRAGLALRDELGVPDKLAALGVDDTRIDEMAEMAVVDPTAGGNPVELTKDAARRLFEECI